MRSDTKYRFHIIVNLVMTAIITVALWLVSGETIAIQSCLTILGVCLWLEVLGMRIRDDILDELNPKPEVKPDNSDLLKLPEKRPRS
jgi:hypothetical protein